MFPHRYLARLRQPVGRQLKILGLPSKSSVAMQDTSVRLKQLMVFMTSWPVFCHVFIKLRVSGTAPPDVV